MVLLGIWWALTPAAVLVGTNCPNGVCDPGEDHDNCPDDCAIVCGNDVCEGGETCHECAQDCWQQCVCGGQYCDDPAEYGGEGSGFEPECNPQIDVDCSYCPSDCGGCNRYVCNPQVCADDYGRCRDCEDYSECLYWNQYCTWYGHCEITDNCSIDQDCPNYPNDRCDTNTYPGVCVPVN
jgi:hypothetical protein